MTTTRPDRRRWSDTLCTVMLRPACLMVFLSIPASLSAAPITLTATNHFGGAQNLVTSVAGSTSATNVSFGNYVVGPTSPDHERPIVPFLGSAFSALVGGSLTSGVLRFSTSFDFLEAGESFSSSVRLFSTSETSLTSANMQTFASLTGDGGGPHTEIGSFLFQDGVFGNWAISLGASSLTALQAMINSGNATIGVAFREFSSTEIDEVLLGQTVTLEVTGEVIGGPAAASVPEPASMVLLGTGVIGLIARRYRRR